MNEQVFDIIRIARMHRGRCSLIVEGWMDIDGKPEKKQTEISFKISEVRVKVMDAPLIGNKCHHFDEYEEGIG